MSRSRLCGISFASILLGILLLAGCRIESQPAGLDPDPNAIVGIGIIPASAALAPSDTLRFTVVAIERVGTASPRPA